MQLLFIPAAGSARAEWVYQVRYFPNSEVAVLPGHPEGKPASSIDDYVAWLRGDIQRKRYRDIVLAGHSMGGAIALLYGVKYGSEVRGLVLIGTGARLRVLPARLKLLADMIKDEAGWRRILENEYRLVKAKVREGLIEEGVRIGAAVALNDHLCCDKFDIMAKVHLIKVPTLVISGSNDLNTPVKYADYLANKIAGAKKVILDGADHWVHLEKPRQVNQAIEEFLSSLS